MKVLFAIDTLGSGGAQRQAVELAVRLVERGDIDARFAVYHPDPFFRPRLEQAGIRVDLLRKSWRYDLLFPRRMRDDLVQRPVDVVHAFMPSPSLWALLALRGMAREQRPALIASERNDQIGTLRLETLGQRFVYPHADAVTVNAEVVASMVEQRLRVPRERIHYIPNGIDLEAWDRAMLAPCPLRLEPGRFHIGLVGRIAPQKQHDLLLDALALIDRESLRSWSVWLIGAGTTQSPAGRGLQQRVHAAGLADIIRFVPEQRDIAAIMARLSLLVLCSRHEGFPNVVLEAMASRLAIVSTRVGDVPNMIEPNRSGLLVPAGDKAALAAALVRVWRMDPDTCTALGTAARTRVERAFSIDAVAGRYLALYRELAEARRRAEPSGS
jgi:glycosyltransferase involved in cell wall biosynthesis